MRNGLLKIFFAGIISMFLLNAISSIYYTVPVTELSNTGVTDFVNEKNCKYSIAVEGFGYGMTNNEGMNNIKDYRNEKIDILLMGSSHMEARQVPQNKTTGAVLNSLFDGSYYVYNIGMGGHDLPHQINNFEKAVRYYKPEKFVIMETFSVVFNENVFQDLVYGNLKTLFPETNTSGIKSYLRNNILLRKMSFFRLLNYKLSLNMNENNVISFISDSKSDGGNNNEENYNSLLNTIMKKVRQICMDNNVSLIIFYHPGYFLNDDGGMVFADNEKRLEDFKKICNGNTIQFIDMTEVFREEYESNYILPYGFFNTVAGKGHLNINGHRLIAEELFKRINSSLN